MTQKTMPVFKPKLSGHVHFTENIEAMWISSFKEMRAKAKIKEHFSVNLTLQMILSLRLIGRSQDVLTLFFKSTFQFGYLAFPWNLYLWIHVTLWFFPPPPPQSMWPTDQINNDESKTGRCQLSSVHWSAVKPESDLTPKWYKMTLNWLFTSKVIHWFCTAHLLLPWKRASKVKLLKWNWLIIRIFASGCFLPKWDSMFWECA